MALLDSFGRIRPPLGANLVRAHPLAQGLVGVWRFAEGGGNTTRDDAASVIAATANANWYPRSSDPSAEFRALYLGVPSGAGTVTYTATQDQAAIGSATFVLWYQWPGGGLDSNRRLWQLQNNNPLFVLGLGSQGFGGAVSGTALSVGMRDDAGANLSSFSANTANADQRVHQLTFVRDTAANTGRFYRDGVADGSFALPFTSTIHTGGGNALFGDSLNGYGAYVLAVQYNRALSPAEIASLYAAPYQMFAPVRTRAYSLPVVSGAVNAVVNAQAGAATTSATATSPVASLVVNAVVNAQAGAATTSATATSPVASLVVNAVVNAQARPATTSATATSPVASLVVNAVVNAQAGAATTSATATSPVVSTTVNAVVNAVALPATTNATATSPAPSLVVNAVVNAQARPATTSATATSPVLSVNAVVNAQAGAATTTATATSPIASLTVNAVVNAAALPATASATATNPAVNAVVNAVAGAATTSATATNPAPSLVVNAVVNAQAGLATTLATATSPAVGAWRRPRPVPTRIRFGGLRR